eukprot:Gregarina_sp_Pseudo_9__3534@NODE_369_length_3023_cov_18_979893_g348_i0_p1_GENE_NODE_369_length_3023_cov_18_979893_g348_i0NODE_369_length_3023_cov_18_979893_g348_i0_p1_ORF_typecomplete_len442_score109_58Branch/PF02485_21/2_6e06Branch/PF02485_21/6_8e03_NODE_369_length_3023_cov_18_979893_g348_i0621387
MQQTLVFVYLCIASVAVWSLYISIARVQPQIPSTVEQEGTFVAEIKNPLFSVERVVLTPLRPNDTQSANTCSLNEAECRSAISKRRLELAKQKGQVLEVHEGGADGVAVLINILRNLDAPTVWHRWVLDAQQWLRDAALENSVPEGGKSEVLRIYINHSPLFSETAVREMLPLSLNNSLIPDPVACADANRNPCAHRLLEYASQDFENAGYFLLLAEPATPLQSFQHMYSSFTQDRRARSSVLDLCYTAMCLPRTLSSKALPREFVEVLLRDDSWVEAGWETGAAGACAPDECAQWQPLAAAFGDEIAAHFVTTPADKDALPQLRPFVQDCCQDNRECASRADAETAEYSAACLNLEQASLEQMLKEKDIWFGTNFFDHTQVTGAEKSLSEFLASQFNSSHSHVALSEHPYQKDRMDFLLPNSTIDSLKDVLARARPWGLV